MEDHVTDEFIYCDWSDENRANMRHLYRVALKGDKEALEELMTMAYECGYREAYGGLSMCM